MSISDEKSFILLEDIEKSFARDLSLTFQILELSASVCVALNFSLPQKNE